MYTGSNYSCCNCGGYSYTGEVRNSTIRNECGNTESSLILGGKDGTQRKP